MTHLFCIQQPNFKSRLIACKHCLMDSPTCSFYFKSCSENSTRCDRELESSSHKYLMSMGFSVSGLYLDAQRSTENQDLSKVI